MQSKLSPEMSSPDPSTKKENQISTKAEAKKDKAKPSKPDLKPKNPPKEKKA